jgi:hypothetical protein
LSDCNQVPLDGCEADVETDVNNCKACGISCAAPNAVAICGEEGCAIQGCVDGFADADLDEANGCEIGLETVGSPPDGALQHLTVGDGVLWGGAESGLLGYALGGDGVVGAVLGETTLPSRIHQLEARGTTLFVALEVGDIRIYDGVDPAEVVQVGLVATSGPSAGFALRDRWLFIADGRDGLRVADVSEASAPRVLAHVPTPDAVNRVQLSGDLALVHHSGRSDVYVFDIGEPRAPLFMGAFSVRAGFDIAAFGGDLLAAASSGSPTVNIYRVRRDSVTWLGQSDGLAGAVRGLDYRFPFLVTLTGGSEVNLELIDLRRPQSPVATDRFTAQVLNSPRAVVFADTDVYVGGSTGLQRFGIEDPRMPTALQDIVSTTELRDLAVRGSTLVVVADGAVEVLDNSDPANPVRRARFGTDVYRAHLTESALYITSSEPAIAGYFLSRLDEPDPQPYVTVGGDRPNDLETSADGRFIYALYGSELRMFESMAVESPQRASLTLEGNCREVIRHPQNPVLYLACVNGVVVVDPTNMTFNVIGTPGGGDVYDIYLFGQMMYGAVDTGVVVYNVFNPTDVNLATTVAVGSGIRRISVQPDWILVGTVTSGMLLPRSLELGEEPVIPSRSFPMQLVALESTLSNFYVGTRSGPYRLRVESGQ